MNKLTILGGIPWQYDESYTILTNRENIYGVTFKVNNPSINYCLTNLMQIFTQYNIYLFFILIIKKHRYQIRTQTLTMSHGIIVYVC